VLDKNEVAEVSQFEAAGTLRAQNREFCQFIGDFCDQTANNLTLLLRFGLIPEGL
jgi:hypothetical protein